MHICVYIYIYYTNNIHLFLHSSWVHPKSNSWWWNDKPSSVGHVRGFRAGWGPSAPVAKKGETEQKSEVWNPTVAGKTTVTHMSSCEYIYSTCCICSYSCKIKYFYGKLLICCLCAASWHLWTSQQNTKDLKSGLNLGGYIAASAVETEVTNSSTVWKLCSPRGPSNGIRISLYHFFWSLAHSCSYTWPGRSTQPNCRSAITCPWTCQQRTCYVERLQNVPLSPFAPCGIFGDMILGDVNLKPQWNYLSFSFKVARQP